MDHRFGRTPQDSREQESPVVKKVAGGCSEPRPAAQKRRPFPVSFKHVLPSGTMLERGVS